MMTRREALKGGSAAAVAAGALLMQERLVRVAAAQTSEPRISLGEDYVIDDDPDGNGDFVVEHVPSGAEFRYDSSQDAWRLGDFQPQLMHDVAYAEHPSFGSIQEAIDNGALAMLGNSSGSAYGNATLAGNEMIMGVGSASQTGDMDASGAQNNAFFFFQPVGDMTVGGRSITLGMFFSTADSLTISGNSTSVTGCVFSAFVGDVTITGNSNSFTGNTCAFANMTMSVDGDNNVVTSNANFDVVDNGTGNEIAHNRAP